MDEKPFDSRLAHLEFIKVAQKVGNFKIARILNKLSKRFVTTADLPEAFKEKVANALFLEPSVDGPILDFFLLFPDPAYLPALRKYSKLGNRLQWKGLVRVLREISFQDAVNSAFEPKLWDEPWANGFLLQRGLIALMSDPRFYSLPETTIEAILRKFFTKTIGIWVSETSQFLAEETLKHKDVLLGLWVKIFKQQEEGDLLSLARVLKTIYSKLSRLEKKTLNNLLVTSISNLSLAKRICIVEYMGEREVLKDILAIAKDDSKRFEEEFVVPAFNTVIERNSLQEAPRMSRQVYFTLRQLAKVSRSEKVLTLLEKLAGLLRQTDAEFSIILEVFYEFNSARAEDFAFKELAKDEKHVSVSLLKILGRSNRGVKKILELPVKFGNTSYGAITRISVLEELMTELDSDDEEKRSSARSSLGQLLPLCEPEVHGIVSTKLKEQD